MKAIATFAFASFSLGVFAADIPKAPVPPSPYLPIIYKYADAMVERGRDTNGLFHSALDRTTLAPLTNRPPAPSGVREQDRIGQKGGVLAGSNPQHDQNFLRLLYTLSELSAKPKYREAADAELRWVVAHGDKLNMSHRPWMLSNRCFDLAPEASYGGAEPWLLALPRTAGFYLRIWATMSARTNNDALLKVMNSVVTLQGVASPAQMGDAISPPLLLSGLSLAIDCDSASRLVPEQLATKFRRIADEQDRMFCSIPHNLKDSGGFMVGDHKSTRADRNTPLWGPFVNRYRRPTTAQVAMMCVSRYENTGSVAYRDLVHAAADAYLKSMPTPEDDVWPMTFGHAISLQVAAWRSTAQQKYLDRARELADFAVKHFFDQGPLPRASLKSNHYEAITGADTLALGLVELHLHILGITAVRYPPNTIDR